MDKSDINIVRHEYGHTLQLEEMGVLSYASDVVLYSVTAYDLESRGKLRYEYYGSPWEMEADQLGGAERTYNNTPWPEDACDSYLDLLKMYFE